MTKDEGEDGEVGFTTLQISVNTLLNASLVVVLGTCLGLLNMFKPYRCLGR